MPVQKDPISDVLQLREQGLTDNLIAEEMRKKGYSPQQVNSAIAQADASADTGGMDMGNFNGPAQAGFQGQGYPAYGGGMPAAPTAPASTDDANLYERIEETVEGMIDEKWDELIGEVKKIVEWKEKMEDSLKKIQNDVDKLKEDFKLLHQGVLGRLEEYDTKMGDVDTELKAVGKVFKDVVPQFVENVKELSSITKGMKKKGE